MSEIAARVLAALSRSGVAVPGARYRDQESYARSEYDMAGYILPFLKQFAPRVDGVSVDLGSGQGGATERYAEALDTAMVGLDFDREKVQVAGRLWKRSRFMAGSAVNLPFRDASLDLLISHDGFEHFMEPQVVLAEACRALRPGGRFLISFAPYYTLKGPHIEHYITVPFAHLLFARQTVARAAELVGQRQVERLPETEREGYRKRLAFGLWQARECVNEMSIRRWERLLLGLEDFELLAYRKYVDRRLYLPLLGLRWTQELVASILVILEKRAGARVDRDALRRAQRADVPAVIYHH